ncbi:hypothetical protein [Xanthomarina gelatinilytica]|jgi:hypothetical protein|uniref:hypothetical protein n=1 Tax=Xanthomarina gelatinilytica TaxID=1137281 RepID=UPI0012DE5711|nr:hypothetical protein [Xanthomarina gelatinilytica]
MKTIKIDVVNGMKAVIIVDKITHLKSNKQYTYVCIGSEAIATTMKMDDVLDLING